jgi:hypothetical protein
MERGEREREEGGKRDRWGGWNGKWEKGRGRGRGRLERWGVVNVGLG